MTVSAPAQIIEEGDRRNAGGSMVPAQTRVVEPSLHYQRRQPVDPEIRIVDTTRQTQPLRHSRRDLAPTARPASVHIVWACMQYATSMQYRQVTLSALSAASGVCERRVRDAFTDCHGMSPTVYLRAVALLDVRQALLKDPSARDAVTRAATDFGFWHLSRFAGQYRDFFGEAPSETVARARALRRVEPK